MFPGRPRRLASVSYVGPARYSLTFCTFDRVPLFTSAALVDAISAQILSVAAASGFDVTAYCFMPDHTHLLIEGTAPSAGSLPAFVKNAKQRSGFYGRRLCGVSVWQPGYFERVLRDSETTQELIAYILANPVRAHLVQHPSEYPFIGSSRYTLEQLMEFLQMHPT